MDVSPRLPRQLKSSYGDVIGATIRGPSATARDELGLAAVVFLPSSLLRSDTEAAMIQPSQKQKMAMAVCVNQAGSSGTPILGLLSQSCLFVPNVLHV